uniref:Protein-L-isoaspartate O-methyltransferase n=2 Tax=Panagrolaimus sp. PS1159 TaxID=55785 RepID=A0AC35GJ30_9BILA
MAYFSLGKSNTELINQLASRGIIKSDRVKNAMMNVDRGDFTSISPYSDQPQSIGCQATISAPHMHAEALEALKSQLKDGAKVLDVGSGSGYLTVCFAKMVGTSGKVVGIEHMHDLVQNSIKNIRKHNADLLDSNQILIVESDGRLGYSAEAPYDAIHVGAASPTFPNELVAQLKNGGRLIVPVGTHNQEFLQIDKISNTETKTTKLLDVQYVPLTSQSAQRCI